MAIVIRKKTIHPSQEVEAPAQLVQQTKRPQTLAEVIDQLSIQSNLADARRRDLISACNSVARLADRLTSDVEAEVNSLRGLLEKRHPVQSGISKKRLANIRSDLATALKIVGIIPPDEAKSALLPAWRTFLAKATKKHHAWFLSRFVGFCSRRGIDPSNVTDTTMREFRVHLEARVLTNDPGKIVKDTAVAFNAIIKRANLDIAPLNTAMSPRYVARRLDAYPASLALDIEQYLNRLREPDLFSDNGPRRPLRPTSLRNIQAHLRQTLDAAVTAGYPSHRFKTLADLVDINVISAAIQQMSLRRGVEIPSSLGNILATLMAIARHYLKLDENVIRRIAAAQRKIGQELGSDRPRMSDKSQRRMDQFETRENIVRLANLPLSLIQRADSASADKSRALDAMIAAAIAFLLCCPMRIKNLSGLHMTEDMTLVKKGRSTVVLIHISPDKTKGRQAIDAVIEPPYSTVIERYITHYRKQIADKPGDWLFPAVSGEPRRPDHFGAMIKQRIFREIGLTMNAHLFRHFSAYVFLEAHPGSYEDVRRVVGHAKMETTTSFYAPASTKATYKRYNDVLRSYATEGLRK